MDETYGTYVDDEYFDNHDYDDDTDDDNDHKNDSYTKEKLRCCYWYFGIFFLGKTINIVVAAWIFLIVSVVGFLGGLSLSNIRGNMASEAFYVLGRTRIISHVNCWQQIGKLFRVLSE